MVMTTKTKPLGSFNTTVKAEWLDNNDRRMCLMEDLRYTDPSGKVWDAPAGSIIDGASIPKFLWRILGSPFVGRYRRSSVIHDVQCEEKEYSSKEVHRMFYDGMLTDSVPRWKARLMYWGVKLGGPKFPGVMKESKEEGE